MRSSLRGMSSTGLTVVVADDHELFRGGLVQLLEERGIRVVGVASNGAQAIALCTEQMPDVALMDLNMPGMSGVEATQRLSAAVPLVKVLVLTVADDARSVTDALLAGAFGYLLKDAPTDQIIEGVKAAASGESLISPRVATQLIRHIRQPAETETGLSGAELTDREQQILELIARGMDNPEIAQTLYLSQHTVKNHVSSILVKLQVENRIQAAVRAVRQGLV
jgi:DNA-binding NarL/FixJ family response regulator